MKKDTAMLLLINKVTASIIILILVFSFTAVASASDSCNEDHVRWASSTNRIYIDNNADCTIPDLLDAGYSSIPVELVDAESKTWWLGGSIFLSEDSRLSIHGDGAGGEVNVLRLKSDNTGSEYDFIEIRADRGEIDIDSTTITSWDTAVLGPDTDHSNGRAFIRARSRLINGNASESRMDIKNSDIGYLGYQGSEAYGLSWKVLGNHSQNPELYDLVGVYGDVTNNDIHHLHFGIYTYGGESMEFVGNTVRDNNVYGIDPHDDSDNILIHDNDVFGNGTHGIICSRRCDNLTITNNRSNSNGGNGIMLHRSVTDSLVDGNVTNDNLDSGLALYQSHDNTVTNNEALRNKRGIRFSLGSQNNIISDNNFSDNTTYGIYTYQGSDDPEGGPARPNNNSFLNNTINDNGEFAAKLKETDENTFSGNIFMNNAKGIIIYGSSPFGNVFNNTNQFIDNGTNYQLKMEGNTSGDITDNTFVGAKYGVQLVNSENILILQNNFTGATNAGIKVEQGSDENTLVLNNFTSNVKGISIYDSNNTTVEENTFEDNLSYALFMKNSQGNILEQNDLSKNDKNYYYARENSTATVVDSDVFAIKVGDELSSFSAVNNDSFVYEIDKGFISTADGTKTSTYVDRAEAGGSIIDFEKRNLAVTVVSIDSLDINPGTWDMQLKEWTAVNPLGVGTITNNYTIGELTTGMSYEIAVNGIVVDTMIADENGEISFEDTRDFSTLQSYSVTEQII